MGRCRSKTPCVRVLSSCCPLLVLQLSCCCPPAVLWPGPRGVLQLAGLANLCLLLPSWCACCPAVFWLRSRSSLGHACELCVPLKNGLATGTGPYQCCPFCRPVLCPLASFGILWHSLAAWPGVLAAGPTLSLSRPCPVHMSCLAAPWGGKSFFSAL